MRNIDTEPQGRKSQPSLIREHSTATLSVHQAVLNDHLRDVKKDYGIFFTPERIVNFMVNLIDTAKHFDKKGIAILEPACGLAQFLMGIKRILPALYERAKLFGVEVNQDIINYLAALSTESQVTLVNTDYLLWQPNLTFDLIIGNPPYGIPSLDSANLERQYCQNR